MNKNRLFLSFLILGIILFSSNFQYISGEIPSLDTAKLRFSQNFFSIFTLIPLSVIALGVIIIFYGFKEKKIQDSQISNKLIMIGITVIFLGFATFGFYLID
jgi:hypothetical protein